MQISMSLISTWRAMKSNTSNVWSGSDGGHGACPTARSICGMDFGLFALNNLGIACREPTVCDMVPAARSSMLHISNSPAEMPESTAQIRAVVFDLDGLMFNTEDIFNEVGRLVLARRNRE